MLPAPAYAERGEADVLNALARARLAEDEGRPVAALSALTAIASRSPDLPGLSGRILEQAIEAGDLARARGAAARLWDAGDRRFDARLVLSVDAIRRSDWRAARDYLGSGTDKTGGDAISRLIVPTIDAWAGAGLGENAPESGLLEPQYGRPVAEPALVLQAALVQLAMRREAAAVALADGVTLTDRTSQLVALRLAATLDRHGEGAAAERLRKRIALAAGRREDPALLLPERPVATPRAGAAFWLALLADGLARTPNGHPRVPLLFARAAHWLDADDWQVRAALVEALDRNGQAEDALAMLSPRREALPPALTMRRAELLADAGSVTEAVKLAEAAASAGPPARSLLVRFADIARRLGDDAATGRAYARLESDLGSGEADAALRGTVLIARAQLRLEAGDWDGAEPLIEQAVALRPNDPVILNFAGYSALERRKDVATSLKRIEAAHSREPQSPSITDSLGWAYVLTGRVDAAVPLLEKAQAGDPQNAVIVEHLGDAYWQAGRRFQARYVWRAAALLAEADMATRLAAKLRDGLTPATIAP